MGHGSIIRSGYKTETGYFCGKDYDLNSGKPFWFFIAPLDGCKGEKFFYVRNMPNGKYEVTGEGYFLYESTFLKEYKKEALEEMGDTVYYYFFDEKTGQVIKKESGKIKHRTDENTPNTESNE